MVQWLRLGYRAEVGEVQWLIFPHKNRHSTSISTQNFTIGANYLSACNFLGSRMKCYVIGYSIRVLIRWTTPPPAKESHLLDFHDSPPLSSTLQRVTPSIQTQAVLPTRISWAYNDSLSWKQWQIRNISYQYKETVQNGRLVLRRRDHWLPDTRMTALLTAISPVLTSKPILRRWYAKREEALVLSNLHGVSMSPCSLGPKTKF